jgi:16S rRNA U516 pseudouridylate synthase RsuA-like enzyme
VHRAKPGTVSLARALSMLGLSSRSEAVRLIDQGRVSVDGRPIVDLLVELVELVEGRNRELRRLLLALGHEVTKLARIAFGSLQLDSLEAGKWRVLEPVEVANLERDAAIEPSAARASADSECGPASRAMTRRGLAGPARVR